MSSNILRIGSVEEVPSKLIDVVFIHGLDGDLERTWHNGVTGASWLTMLAEDHPQADVWSLGYEAWSSGWRGTAMPLQDRAVNVLTRLQAEDFGARPIVLICHSMGGLLAKQLLFQASVISGEYADISRAIRGIVFCATPHTGSGLASLAAAFRLPLRGTAAIRDLQDNDAYLRMLNDWYRNSDFAIELHHLAFIEKLDTFGVRVVDEGSGNPSLRGVVPVPIDANHVDICKPEGRGALVYRSTRRFVNQLTPPPPSFDVSGSQSDRDSSVLRPLTVKPEGGLSSSNFATPASIEFENKTNEPVDIYWHDYEGYLVLQAALSPGEVRRFETFVSHPWSVMWRNGQRSECYLPALALLSRVEIT